MAAMVLACACQSPTDPDDVIGVDEYLEITASPDPVNADASPDNKTYTVVVNDVTERRVYDWKASFAVVARLNEKADDDDLDFTWPIDMTSATFKVDQATGGIRNPPTGGEVEHSEVTIVHSTGNRYANAGSQQTLSLDLWYDLPNLRKEGLIVATLSFRDADGRTFSRAVDIRIAP
jgi:hypothetical protein